MRVLYVSKALVVAAYRDKIRALAPYVEISAVIPERWGAQPVEPGEPVPVPLERCPALLHGHNHLHVYRRIGRLLDRIRPDLVHIDEEPYSAVSFQLSVLCAHRGIPSLVFAWQNLDKRLPFPFGTMRSSVFRRVSGAIAGSQRAAEVLHRAGYHKPLAVIPQFGVDPARFRPDREVRRLRRARLGAAEEDFVIGFGGRLVREKGVQLLLAALPDLPRARLVVIGDGPERERLARFAERTGVPERVHFAGPVPSGEMPGWLPAFDVVVLPSLSRKGWMEQFGRILIEAMACGVPVVGSDSGEIPRVIGDVGRVVPEGDVPALAATLRELAGSSELRSALSQKARARVGALYTQERIALDTVCFYRELVGASTPVARGLPA